VIDRRTTLKWVAAAAACAAGWDRLAAAAQASAPAVGYGTDPLLTAAHRSGELWPLTMTPAERRAAAALSDLIIPADEFSKGAAALGIVDFLDEWISAPYPRQQSDRAMLIAGLGWIDQESQRRFQAPFAELGAVQQRSICDDICWVPQAQPRFAEAAIFFVRYRDLTAGGFYTTAAGRLDLQYQGNTPLSSFDGPPLAVKQRVGVA
jgi:Gluconate 2-dehydrogenase subunit 3